jgi:hypothetical protein
VHLDGPGSISVSAEVTGVEYWRELFDAFTGAFTGSTPPDPMALLVFKRVPGEPDSAPADARWALLDRWQFDVPLVVNSGDYMVVLLATQRCYDKRASYDTTVAIFHGDAPTQAPATATFTVVNTLGDAQVGVRVGLGTASGRTDETGHVTLTGVDPFFSTIKLGEQCTDAFVVPLKSNVYLMPGSSYRFLLTTP